MVMFKALDAFKLLRVSLSEEAEGLDVSQHGNTAYPEYVTGPLSTGHVLATDSDASGKMPAIAAPAE
jgi:hypothetical protein